MAVLDMPKLPGFVELNDVAATASGDVWIVGDQYVRTTRPHLEGPGTVGGGSGSVERPLVLHWDGSRWRRDDVARLVGKCPWRDGSDWIWECGTGLTAVDATTTGEVWAVGTDEAVDFGGYATVLLHWTRVDIARHSEDRGGRWSQRARRDCGGAARRVDARSLRRRLG